MTLNVAPSCFAWLALLVSQRNAMFILGGGFLMTLIQDVVYIKYCYNILNIIIISYSILIYFSSAVYTDPGTSRSG